MITENVRKQLRDYKKHGKDLKYLINYISGLIEDKEASDAEVKAAEEFKEYVATDPSPMELLTAAGFKQIK